MSGEQIEFSAADLAATALAFNPRLSKAPLVIGHPATDDPAQGWVSSLVANARGLFAHTAQIAPAFAEAVRAGRYGTLSAKFYRPTDANNPKPGVWYLRHVGALGAAAPGVKGLDAPAFADDDSGVCFQEGIAFALVKDPEEATEPLDNPAILMNPALSQPKESPVTLEEKTALEAENNRLRTLLATNERAQTHAAHAAFCDGLPGMMPAWRDVAVATLDHLAAQVEPVQFGEGDAKAPLADKFKALLSALPAAVQFSESASTQRAAGAHSVDESVSFAAPSGYRVDAVAMATHNRAVAHMASHKTSYIEAVQAVA